jgi:uncharacterized protein DUF5134
LFSSIALSVAFTIMFVVTGAYALVRFALITADAAGGGDRLAEMSHLLMSVAMIAMTWGAGGGSLARTLQIAVFGAFGIWFLRRVVLGRSGHELLPAIDHAVTDAAMVWMVAAMPLIMGMSMAAMAGGGSTGHAGHGGHGSNDQPGGAMPGTGELAAPAPAWVVVVTVAFAVLLAASALFWAVRAWRGESEPVDPAPVGDPVDGGGATAVRTSTVDARTGLAALTGTRQDAGCHLLMSVGTAGMLLAML